MCYGRSKHTVLAANIHIQKLEDGVKCAILDVTGDAMMPKKVYSNKAPQLFKKLEEAKQNNKDLIIESK